MPTTWRGSTWRLSACAVAVSLIIVGCGEGPAPAARGRVSIAAAADLRFALDEIAELIRRESPGIDLTVTYGSSGTLYAQLVNGAPHDMFLSADRDYPRRLTEMGLTLPDTTFSYATGRLVVWLPTTPEGDQGLGALTAPSITRVAIANPEHAPYGVAAVAALRAAKIYDTVMPKLVYGENVAQAMQFAQSGAAQAAIVARALVVVPAAAGVGGYWDIPEGLYPRMDQVGVILKRTQYPEAARLVRAFVLGDRGREVLRRYGFGPPGA